MNPYDAIEMQRYPLTEDATITVGGDVLTIPVPLAHAELAKLDGDWAFIGNAIEVAAARKHFGLPQFHNCNNMFEEYAALCLADRVNPDTCAWYERLAVLVGVDAYSPPIPVRFEEYLAALYRSKVYGEPWAEYPLNLNGMTRVARKESRHWAYPKAERNRMLGEFVQAWKNGEIDSKQAWVETHLGVPWNTFRKWQ